MIPRRRLSSQGLLPCDVASFCELCHLTGVTYRFMDHFVAQTRRRTSVHCVSTWHESQWHAVDNLVLGSTYACGGLYEDWIPMLHKRLDSLKSYPRPQYNPRVQFLEVRNTQRDPTPIVTVHPCRAFVCACTLVISRSVPLLWAIRLSGPIATPLRAEESKVAVISSQGSLPEVTVNDTEVNGKTSPFGFPVRRESTLEVLSKGSKGADLVATMQLTKVGCHRRSFEWRCNLSHSPAGLERTVNSLGSSLGAIVVSERKCV